MAPSAWLRADVTFSLQRLRFFFQAADPVCFPPGGAGNVIRGALGWMLRQNVPDTLYSQIFEPSRQGGSDGPSGLRNWPRPFTLRASHLDGRAFAAGEPFHFDMHLFDLRNPVPAALEMAFQRWTRATLVSVDVVDVSLSLAPETNPPQTVTIELVTPLELKSGNAISAELAFPILFARIRDRISTLRGLYGAGPLQIDFKGLGERAAGVRTVRSEIKSVDVARRSSRTGQVHGIGGWTGRAEYAGDLGEFLPYLRAAEWCGVGRHCVWGKGQIQCH